LEDRVVDRIERMMLGLDDPSGVTGSLEDRLRSGISGHVYPIHELIEMEDEAKESGDSHLWVLAARLNAETNAGREAEARMTLSEQALPYVFPGELHPMMVDLLAIGERVIPALHVDWIRKITTWSGSALNSDCTRMGMWFWPILQCLDAGKLAKPLRRLFSRSLPDGSKGLAASYAWRLGLDVSGEEPVLSEKDMRILALVRLGDQVQAA
jgi:hypothetical protein